jgi:hypothetical protein
VYRKFGPEGAAGRGHTFRADRAQGYQGRQDSRPGVLADQEEDLCAEVSHAEDVPGGLLAHLRAVLARSEGLTQKSA